MARKKSEVQFYFDADILGLAKVICPLPGDPGAVIHNRVRPKCIVPEPRWKDRQWIPLVAKQHWIAITRDSNILDHLSLLQLIQDHGLRLVALTGTDGATKWGQLEIVMSQWRHITGLIAIPGPALFTCTRTSFRRVDLKRRLDEVRRTASENPNHPEASKPKRRPPTRQQERLF